MVESCRMMARNAAKINSTSMIVDDHGAAVNWAGRTRDLEEGRSLEKLPPARTYKWCVKVTLEMTSTVTTYLDN